MINVEQPSNLNSAPFQVHYYNEIHAVWEPLIERVEGKTPWSLKLNVRKPVLCSA